MSASEYDVLGVALDFFVVRDRRYIRTYDENCKEIGRVSMSEYESVTVGGQTFTVKDGRNAITFDANCDVISKRHL